MRLEIRKHSDGFEWNYSGSGPAQLALAILADFIGPKPPPNKCPYCGGLMTGWQCMTDKEICGFNGAVWEQWEHIQGELVHYQNFKRDIVSGFDRDGFTLESDTIKNWMECQIIKTSK